MNKIILKVDDCWVDKIRNEINYRKFIEFIFFENIKISLGIVGISLEKSNNDDIEFIKSPLIEPYNHSYYHFLNNEKKEFFKTDKYYQFYSIVRTNNLIKEKLYFNVKTIGFVANASDKATIEILKEISEIQNIYYFEECYNYAEISTIGKKIININQYDVLEHNGHIDYDRFISLYRGGEDYYIFQMHPGGWNDKDIENCKKIILFLKNNGNFIFPSEL